MLELEKLYLVQDMKLYAYFDELVGVCVERINGLSVGDPIK